MARAQVATDALSSMERAMATQNIQVNDRQLACARINSQEGQDYLAAMVCSACVRTCQPNGHIAVVRSLHSSAMSTRVETLTVPHAAIDCRRARRTMRG